MMMSGLISLYVCGDDMPEIFMIIVMFNLEHDTKLIWFVKNISPCGCGNLSVRLGSTISPPRHRVVVDVHWRDAQGWRSISLVVATFNHVGGSFLSVHGCHRRFLNNPIFSNFGLCLACWAHFMCHHELWPTSVSHPFPFLNSSLGLAGEKHYQKITIPIFRLVLPNFPIPG